VKVLERVEILIEGDRIRAIGPAGRQRNADQVIDADGCVVLPGLVDPHRHVGTPGTLDGDERHRQTELPIGVDDGTFLERRVLRGFRRALAGGTSTVGIKCGGAGAKDEVERLAFVREIGRTSAVKVCPTLIAAPRGADGRGRDDRISAMIGEAIPAARRRRLSRFCDVACGDGGYALSEAEAILRAGRGAGLRPKLHVLCGELDGAALLAAKLDALSIDHLRDAGRRALEALKERGVICVLLPGDAFLNGGTCPNGRKLIDAGMAIALGTDYGFDGRGVESVWMALAAAVEGMGLSPEEAITAVTLNAAAAIEMADETGSIELGKAADLAILDVDDYREIGRSVGCEPVRTTVVNGRAVFSS